MDRLDEWKTFIAVASLKSFIHAARSLGRSPQAVTRAIAALEARIGTRLLHRTTRSVSLTTEGERYVERSRRALSELDALEARSDADAELTGTLSITAPVLFGQLHVLPLVRAFLTRHPALAIRVTLLDRVVSLAEEGIDLAVRIGELPDSALIARTAGQVRTVTCASPKYLARAGTPRSPEALAKHACIAFTGTSPVPDRWSFPRKGQRDRRVAVSPRLVVNTAQAAIDAAVAGFGITRVISYQVTKHVAADALRVILASFEPAAVPVHLVQLPGIQSRAATAFAALAVAELSAHR